MGAWNDIRKLHRESTFGAKEGVAFRYFSRPLASLILYFIQNSRITPNQVTILSLLVGIAGSLVHSIVLTWTGLLIGGVLFMLAHMLDALDGQLAQPNAGTIPADREHPSANSVAARQDGGPGWSTHWISPEIVEYDPFGLQTGQCWHAGFFRAHRVARRGIYAQIVGNYQKNIRRRVSTADIDDPTHHILSRITSRGQPKHS